jgi:hypothetical protein
VGKRQERESALKAWGWRERARAKGVGGRPRSRRREKTGEIERELARDKRLKRESTRAPKAREGVGGKGRTRSASTGASAMNAENASAVGGRPARAPRRPRTPRSTPALGRSTSRRAVEELDVHTVAGGFAVGHQGHEQVEHADLAPAKTAKAERTRALTAWGKHRRERAR